MEQQQQLFQPQPQVQPQVQSQAQQVATTSVARPIDTFKGILEAPSIKQQFKNALGTHADTFLTSLIDVFNDDAKLKTVRPEQRMLVYNQFVVEALRAAVLHLPLTKGLGFAYVIVYNNKRRKEDGSWENAPTPTFMLGYKGYIQLAMRSGQYKCINCDVVYEGEFKGREKLTGAIDLSGERRSDKVVGYFAHFELLNGFSKTLYMTVDEVANYAKRYSAGMANADVEKLAMMAGVAGAGKQVGWNGSFDDMAMKTCLRRLLSKYGILSVEMETALSTEVKNEEKAIESEQNSESVIVTEAEVVTEQQTVVAATEPDF